MTSTKIRDAAVLAAIPGVTVGEVRKFLGLNLFNDERDHVALNMPISNKE